MRENEGRTPMTTEQEIIGVVRETRIDWDATPQGVMGPPNSEIRTQEDFERLQQRDRDMVGYGYFFVNVSNMSADLALMHCTRVGYWETEIIPQRFSPLLGDDLERAVQEAGGAMNWSGHYPLNSTCLMKLQASYLGGQ
jgi:hypothetical protein